MKRECRLRRVFLTIIFSAFFILIILNFQDKFDDVYYYVQHLHCKTFHNFNGAGHKRVLFYTTYFDREIWPHSGVGSTWNLTGENGKPCTHNCLISYNKCDLPFSNAVVFHEADLPRPRTLKSLAIYMHRHPLQRWVYFTHENPHNAKHDPALYNGIFNWTITYRRDSDVFYPYGYYREIKSASEIPKNHFTTNYAKGKNKLIVWAASHCGILRDKVVEKLLTFLPVTVIGKCSKFFHQTTPSICKRGSKTCSSFLNNFKFYLAFENGMCFDYITEKYWETPFDNNMVPIVLGSNYDAKVAMPGSFINVLDFTSIEALSNYIEYLDKNDTAYNEYFRWKAKYTRFVPGQESWTCQLCANLHNDVSKKVYNNLGTYWGVESNCNRSYVDKINRIIEG